MRSFVTYIALVCATVVFSTPSASASDKKILRGQWGGAGASLWAGAGGADGDFYCSMGRITQPIELDEDGHFCVVGYLNYYDGTPPIKQSPATYIGDVDDGVMRIAVHTPDREPWYFELHKGEMGETPECLMVQ